MGMGKWIEEGVAGSGGCCNSERRVSRGGESNACGTRSRRAPPISVKWFVCRFQLSRTKYYFVRSSSNYETTYAMFGLHLNQERGEWKYH